MKPTAADPAIMQLDLFAPTDACGAPIPTRNLRPPLKWPGGKTWQALDVQPLWHSRRHRRLVEPFCGALGMTLGLGPKRALLNDINQHLVNFHRCVQNGFTVDIAMENDEALYYDHRRRFNALASGKERTSRETASLFYFLNRTGFNGLCRFNNRGRFNVPFGKYKTITYKRDFSAYVPVFANWTFMTGDFEDVPLEADDFIYADPPYDVEFTKYAEGGFSWHDQTRLVRWLMQHGGPVVLVNQATPRIVELYQSVGFKLAFLNGPRRISCTGDRTPAREVLATRNL
jgi:DNA adenine methylase